MKKERKYRGAGHERYTLVGVYGGNRCAVRDWDLVRGASSRVVERNRVVSENDKAAGQVTRAVPLLLRTVCAPFNGDVSVRESSSIYLRASLTNSRNKITRKKW